MLNNLKFFLFSSSKNCIIKYDKGLTKNSKFPLLNSPLYFIPLNSELTPFISYLPASYNIPFFQTSAKDGTNVNEVFENLIRRINLLASRETRIKSLK